MARVKYDVRGVEGGRKVIPAGVYNVKITSADITKPDGKDQRIEAVFEVVQDKDHKGAKLYEYINLESEQSAWKLREFTDAVGLPEHGTLDSAKLVGKILGVKTFVRPADDARGFDESARVRRMFALDGASANGDVEDLDDDDDSDEEDYSSMSLADLKAELTERGLSTKGKKPALISRLEEDDASEEDEDEEEEDTEGELEWDDLEAMSRAELRQLNKDEEAGVKITKSMDDDAVRAALADALEIEVPEDEEEDTDEEDEEEEEEDEDTEDEEDEDDYEEWDLDDLRTELEERSLSTKGGKKVLVGRLRKDDTEEDKPF